MHSDTYDNLKGYWKRLSRAYWIANMNVAKTFVMLSILTYMGKVVKADET